MRLDRGETASQPWPRIARGFCLTTDDRGMGIHLPALPPSYTLALALFLFLSCSLAISLSLPLRRSLRQSAAVLTDRKSVV